MRTFCKWLGYDVITISYSANNADRLLAPLLTRFTIIHLKPYTKEEFVEIAVNVLNRDEGIDKDAARFIAELVFKVPVNSFKIGPIVKTKKPAITNDVVNDHR